MRQAKINDYWRDLGKVVAASKGLQKIEQFNEGGSLGDSIDLDGLIGIVGANGVGKSSFYHYITDAEYSGIEFKEHSFTLHSGQPLKAPLSKDDIDINYVNPIIEVNNIKEMLPEYASTYEQFDPIEVDKANLDKISYVLGCDYENIEIQEIEYDDGVAPRIVAKNATGSYDNQSLSLGEQIVIYLFWVLAIKYNRPGVFFIEEPESGLSPISQQRLIDFLAYLSSDKKKQIIMTTHSSYIAERLGPGRLIVLEKDIRASWQLGTNRSYIDDLGLVVNKKGIICLEDNKAKLFLSYLLTRFDSSFEKLYEKVFLDGESNVYEVVSRIGNDDGEIKIIGVLDADEKGKEKYKGKESLFYFLPGVLSPEEEVIAAIENNLDSYSELLKITPERMKRYQRQLRGTDHHDYFIELSKKIGNISWEVIYNYGLDIWLALEADLDGLKDFIVSFDDAINRGYVECLINDLKSSREPSPE